MSCGAQGGWLSAAAGVGGSWQLEVSSLHLQRATARQQRDRGRRLPPSTALTGGIQGPGQLRACGGHRHIQHPLPLVQVDQRCSYHRRRARLVWVCSGTAGAAQGSKGSVGAPNSAGAVSGFTPRPPAARPPGRRPCTRSVQHPWTVNTNSTVTCRLDQSRGSCCCCCCCWGWRSACSAPPPAAGAGDGAGRRLPASAGLNERADVRAARACRCACRAGWRGTWRAQERMARLLVRGDAVACGIARMEWMQQRVTSRSFHGGALWWAQRAASAVGRSSTTSNRTSLVL